MLSDKEIQFFMLVGLCTLLLLIFFMIGFFIHYHKKGILFVKERQQLTSALLHSQLEIQEQTLNHISAEIHDNIGQTLSLAKLTLNTVDLGQEEKAAEKLYNSKELVGKAITDLRNLSRTLHADAMLASGLIKAIENEMDLIAKTGAIQTSIHVLGNPSLLPPQRELLLFRTVQEALNNSMKHSGANQLEILVNFDAPFLELTVRDNGKGFNADEGPQNGGTGLRNMKNRMKLLGGDLHILSKQTGTSVTMKVPLTSAS